MKESHGRPRRRSGPHLAVPVVLAVLAAGLLGGCGEARPATSSDGVGQPASAEEPPARPGPVLVTGTVTRNGRPVPDAALQLQLWPAQEDAEVGDAVALKTLGPVSTDEDGGYEFELARADLPSEYVAGNGIVNFDVGLLDPLVAPVSTSAEYVGSARAWTEVDGTAADGPKRMDFDLGRMKATEPSAQGPTQHWDLVELDG